MPESLFSPSWYRVAALKPRLRSHVEIHRHSYRGELWYVLQDHISGRFQRFNPSAYLLIGLMDGSRTVEEIWETARGRLGDDAPTQDEVIHLLSQLHGVDVLQCDVTPDTAELFKRSEKRRQSTWKQNLLNPLSMRFPLLDPERFLVRFEPVVRPFLGWLGTLVWLGVVGAALVVAGIHWSELTRNLADRILAPRNLLLLWLTFPILKAFHELGHAFAIKVWGGEVHEMGIILLVLTPVPYVDASSASAFRDKWKRIVVGAAGMIVEVFLAALALFVWVNAEPGPIRSVTHNLILMAGVSALLFNGNPLLRYDAYYMLSDLLEIPNLGPRGLQYAGYLVQRYVFGLTDPEPPLAARGERAWFVIYTVASWVYRLFIYVGIVVFIAGKFFVVGILLATWAVATMFVIPAGKGLRFLFSSPRLAGRKRRRAMAASAFAVAVVLVIIFGVPVPLSTRVEGVTWIPEECFVRAGTEGFVDRVVAAPGAEVRRGDLLIECSDPFLPAEIKGLEARLRELEVLYDTRRLSDRVQAEITKKEVEHVSAQLDRARERAGELMVRSGADGTFLVPTAEDLPGRFVKRGELLGYVVSHSAVTARVVVTQENVDLVRERTRDVAVRLPERIGETMPASIRREVPAATDQLPSKTLSQEGGGEIAIDPRDTAGVKAFQKVFLFDLELAERPILLNVGGRVYARFDHGWEPLAWRWYRAVRQLFLRKLNV
jgi:putative peptide zinc metalloprotease protein